MGREVRRIAIDFKWPIRVVWKGYRNPYSPIECKACDGTGMPPEMKKLSDDWYSLDKMERYAGWQYHLDQQDVDALVEADRLWDFTRVPLNDKQKKDCHPNGWLKYPNGHRPTAQEVNAWARKGLGHDSINHWICVKARAKRLGLSEDCELCGGRGHYWCDEKYEKRWDKWKSIEPPEGDGWQMWETTTEGSPISPVFETPEALARWLADNNASTFGSDTTTYEKWLGFIMGPGWAPSMVADSGGVRSGVEAVQSREAVR